MLCGCPQRAAQLRQPCPREAPAPPGLPYARPVHDSVRFWIDRSPAPDRLLLSADEIAAHNTLVQTRLKHRFVEQPHGLATRAVDRKAISAALSRQLQTLERQFDTKKRVTREGRRPRGMIGRMRRRINNLRPSDQIRLAYRPTPLFCFPSERPLYDEPWQLAFDLSRCSLVRASEPVRVLGQGPRLWYVWTRYAQGWVRGADLTEKLTAEQQAQILHPDRFALATRDHIALLSSPTGSFAGTLSLGQRLPLLEETPQALKLLAALPAGRLGTVWAKRDDGLLQDTPRLTRAAFWKVTFGQLHAPYGWGGSGARRDCSRLLMDSFRVFGLQLPRNSWWQSQSGTSTIDVKGLSDSRKRQAIEAAAGQGIVLLYLPGHIMLYLGRDGSHLYALHQFSGYLVPCPAGGETMVRPNRTAVTSLELGRGSSRRAFIERITRLVIFGPAAAQPVAD